MLSDSSYDEGNTGLFIQKHFYVETSISGSATQVEAGSNDSNAANVHLSRINNMTSH